MSDYLSIEEFFEKYTVNENHFEDNASFEGALFETYGAELNYVINQPEDRIWTWVDGENGTFLTQGFAHVNRIGYLITNEKYKVGDTVEYLVSLDNEDEND